MNPISESWKLLADSIWKRRIYGGQKKRAISYEARYNELLRMHRNDVPAAFKAGWRAGWDEAIQVAGIKFEPFVRPEDYK